MKKILKRLLPFSTIAVLIIALCCSLSAVNTGGEANLFQYEKEDGYCILVGYTGEDKSVAIPATFEGLPVTEIAAYAFADNAAIEEMIIPQNITTIGIGAFKNCTSLKSVTIEKGVKAIASRAFENTALTSVIVPDSVVAIGHGAFKGCDAMESITLPFVGANLSDSNNYFGYIFGAISYVANVDYVPASLNTVVLSGACTKVPAYSFLGCESITSITLGEKVDRIGSSAFQSCTGLKSIYIPITLMKIPANAFFYNSPFIGCTDLTIYAEADYVADFGTYWCNITETEKATVKTGVSYSDYLKAIAD